MLGSCVRHSLAAYPRVVTTHQLTHCTVAQRLGIGSGPHAGSGAGELPERGRQRDHSRGAAPLHGRPSHAAGLKFPARIAGFDTQERWQSGRMYLTRNQA